MSMVQTIRQWWQGKSGGGLSPQEQIWLDVYGSLKSQSGQSVTVERALQVSTVLACVRVLAEGIAQMPLKLYQGDADGTTRRVAREQRLYQLLYEQPNGWQSSFEWRETLMFHATLCGNGFAFINAAGGAGITEILPLLPQTVTIHQDRSTYAVTYEYRPVEGPMITIPAAQMFHLRGPSWNSVSGLDALKMAREAVGLAMATETHSARLHANAARPGGVLTTDQKLDDKQRANIKASWQEQFTQGNLYRTAVLEAGLKWQQLAMTGVDSQHIETRRHQVEEICRMFRIWPQMVGFSDKTATYASAEQFFIAHVVHSLQPWVVRWEQAITRDLLTAQQRAERYFAKFTMQSLLRGDAKTRAEFYGSGITNGWLTRNEARLAEELDPLDGLDTPLMPLNMTDGTAPPAPVGGD